VNAKKILVMPDGNWLAHVSRPFEIAKVLRQFGHEVIFAGEGQYMKLPRKAGFPVIPIKTIGPDRVLKSTRRGRVNFYNYELLKDCVKEDLKLFEKITPDVVLGDFRPSLNTSCRIAGLGLVVTINAGWTNHSAVKTRSIEHARIGRLIKKVLGKRLYTRLRFHERIKKLIGIIDCAPFKKLNREMGLPPCRNICDCMQGDLNLLTDTPEYAPTNDLPPNFHYIGPIIWEPQSRQPAWMDSLNPDTPTLYFTMGSTGHPAFFHKAIEIFGNTEYQCIMTTSGMVNIENAPGNFFITDYAPGSKIMEKCDVVICHGGNGTLYQAMSKGVPIIGIPTMFEQEFNMQRAVDLGIAIQLNELKFKPAYLVDAVRKILTDKSYKQNALRFKNIQANYTGPRKGAELINSYLGGRPGQYEDNTGR
jgi:UDP:flavonoid glycosyltransferase YjiC (YdhE family)